jgi:hypothetical protein
VRLTYRPAAGEPREWKFRPLDLDYWEAELVEDTTGLTYLQWAARFYAGSIRARRVALWLLLRREQPALALDDVQFRMTEFGCFYDGSETSELRRQITDDPDIDEATRGALLAQLADPDDDDTSAELEDTADQVEEGKASAPAAAAGNGASPTS